MITNTLSTRPAVNVSASPAPALRIGGRQWLLVAAIFALALFLRAYGIERMPFRYETTDEYHYMWAGLTLLHEGRALAWSELPIYDEIGGVYGRTTFDGLAWRIVTPALDHPPLYSLLAGVVAHLSGAEPSQATFTNGAARDLWHINLRRARLWNLLLFVASFFLLLDLGRRVFGFGAACLALLFYATITHIVLHNRLLVTESLSTPILLFNLCVLQRYLAGELRERRFGVLTLLACVAATMTKLVAVCQAGVILFLLLLAGRRRAARYPILSVAAGAALYMAFGAWQGWAVFWAVLRAQGSRFFGLDTLTHIIVNPLLVHTADFSYPLFLGWAACLASTLGAVYAQERPDRPIPTLTMAGLLATPLLYLLWFTFFAAVPVIFGWHALPFYPFLCLGLAALVAGVWRRANRLGFAILMVLLLPYIFDFFFMNNSRAGGVIRWAYLTAATATVLCSFLPGRRGIKVLRFSIVMAVGLTVIIESSKVLMITFM